MSGASLDRFGANPIEQVSLHDIEKMNDVSSCVVPWLCPTSLSGTREDDTQIRRQTIEHGPEVTAKGHGGNLNAAKPRRLHSR